MAGQFKGVKTLIQYIQTIAHYTDCGSNLGNRVAKPVGSCTEIKDDLALINEIYILFANTIQFRNIHGLNNTEIAQKN